MKEALRAKLNEHEYAQRIRLTTCEENLVTVELDIMWTIHTRVELYDFHSTQVKSIHTKVIDYDSTTISQEAAKLMLEEMADFQLFVQRAVSHCLMEESR